MHIAGLYGDRLVKKKNIPGTVTIPAHITTDSHAHRNGIFLLGPSPFGLHLS